MMPVPRDVLSSTADTIIACNLPGPPTATQSVRYTELGKFTCLF